MFSVYPFATIRARTSCCFGRSTHLDSTMLDHCSCESSFDVVSTCLPSRALTVFALNLILRCGCSPVVGLSFTGAPAVVFCCLLALPSATSSGSGLVDDVGIGSAGRCVIGGAVAIGDVGSCVLCCFFGEPSSFCSPALSLPSDDALVVASLCCFAVCCCRCGNGIVVGVVVVGIVGVVSADAGVFHGPMLITSKSCWLYLLLL